MSKGILSAIKKYNLNHADNPDLAELRKNHWQYRISTKGKDNLFDDAANGLVTFGKRPFVESIEFKSFKKTYLHSAQEDEGKKKKLKAYLKKLFFAATPDPDFERCYNELKTAWKSGIPTFFRNAMISSTKDQGYTLKAMPETLIIYEGKKWHVKARLSEISFKDPEKKQNELPGTFTAYFVLLDGVFTFETYETENNLFHDLCLKKYVKITSELLTTQLKEYEFQQALDDLEFNLSFCKDNRKIPGQEILNEIKHLKAIHTNQPSFDEMKQILIVTNTLIQDQSSHPNLDEYIALISLIEKRSWGKIIAGAMLCLTGIILNIISGALLGSSLGVSIPLSVPGMILGTTCMVGGGFLLFKSLEKKPLVEKMNVFIQSVENSNDEVIMKKR